MPASACALFTITFDPFCKPWKKLRGVIAEARRRGWEIVVALDDRTCDACRFELEGTTVVPFTSHGMTERGYSVVSRIKSEFALMLADDEVPSTPLWDFAASPPSPSRFGVPVVPLLGDKLMRGHVGMQERLIWTEGWRFVPRTLPDGRRTLFEGHVRSDAPMVALMDDKDRNPGLLIGHYLLEAPRADREAKAQRYASFDPWGEHTARLFYEEQPDLLIPIPESIRRYLPQEAMNGD